MDVKALTVPKQFFHIRAIKFLLHLAVIRFSYECPRATFFLPCYIRSGSSQTDATNKGRDDIAIAPRRNRTMRNGSDFYIATTW